MMDLTEAKKVWFQNPYTIYFRINDQESFSVGNLTLAAYLPLKSDDEYAVKYIRKLISDEIIVNTDPEIRSISRSTNNQTFVPLDEGALEEGHQGSEIQWAIVEDIDFDKISDFQESQDINGACNLSVPVTPPPEQEWPSKSFQPTYSKILPSLKKKTLSSSAAVVLDKTPSSVFAPPCNTSSSSIKHAATANSIMVSASEAIASSSVTAAQSHASTSTLALPSVWTTTARDRTANSSSGFFKQDKKKALESVSSLRTKIATSKTGKISSHVTVSQSLSSPSTSSAASTFHVNPDSSEARTDHERVILNSRSKPRSEVWQHFVKVDAISARCTICTSILKHGGNTSNLKQHLDRKHTISQGTVKRRCLEILRDSSNPEVSPNKKKRTEDVDDSTPREPGTQEKKLSNAVSTYKNEKISTAFQRVKSFNAGGTNAEKITEAILYMLAVDNCPLSLVENEGFLNLMKTTVPIYNVPSRRTITRLMDDKYALLQEVFKRELQHAGNFSITCDIWSDVSNRGYLGATIHYLSGMTISRGCLGVFPLEGSHTAHYISEVLINAIQSFNIDFDTISAVVTDNGANIKKAVIDTFGSFKHISCFAHVLSHIVPDAIKATSGIEETIAKVKQIVSFSRRSVVAADELRRLQIRDGKTDSTALKFKQDVPTRWNATLLMIERFLELNDYVYPVSLKCSGCVSLPTREELEVLADVVQLLKPIENVTSEASGDTYVTSSLIIPLIRCMTFTISKRNPKSQAGISLKAHLLEQLHRRFKDYETSENLAIATILDPRFKKIHFESETLCTAALTKIDCIIKSESREAAISAIINAPEKNSVVENEASIWSFHDALIASSGSDHGTLQSDCDDLHLELRQYLSQPVVSRSENPVEYWTKLKSAYPKLYPCALKYLGLVATSVPCERLFSKAGAIKAERRSRLTGNRLNELTFLSSLDKKYWGIR